MLKKTSVSPFIYFCSQSCCCLDVSQVSQSNALPTKLPHVPLSLANIFFFLSDFPNFLNGTPSLSPMQLFLSHTWVRIPILSFLSCLCSTCNPAFSPLLRSHSYVCSVYSLCLDASFSWVLSTRVRRQHSFSFLGFLPPASVPHNLPCIAQGVDSKHKPECTTPIVRTPQSWIITRNNVKSQHIPLAL